MAIYDCFQYFNEDHILDLRFNILNKKVDYFVISESTKTHQGKTKNLNFDIDKFKKFKNKIIYIVSDYKEDFNFTNHKGGESIIEQHQRNSLINGIKKANDNDLILLSDSDEIPDLKKLNQIKNFTKFTAFSQMMFMYKINLQNLNESNWIGTKAVLKKNMILPQKLRNLKFKNYPFWRLDKSRLQIINGGWHFSFLQTPNDIIKKIQSYSHGEFNTSDITDETKIQEKISKGVDIFNRGFKLQKINIDENYPEYIRNNQFLLKDWII